MFSMFRAFFLKADEQKPKLLMQKPLLERSYVEKWCRNHGNRYIELPKAITWFDGEVESCCFFFAAISSYALFYRPIAAPKALELVPKGLEHALLTTEFAAKTCHDTGSGKQRLCLRDNLSHVSWFYQTNLSNRVQKPIKWIVPTLWMTLVETKMVPKWKPQIFFL